MGQSKMAVPTLLQSIPASDLTTYHCKRWTVHVMWDPKQAGFSYSESENTLIVSPFLRHESLFKMRGVPLGAKGCRFDWPFRRAIEEMSNCSVYTGVWELPNQPAAIMLDLRGNFEGILANCLGAFCEDNGIATPANDSTTLAAIAFGFKVAQLLHNHYVPSFGQCDGEMLTKKWRKPILQVQIHDWIAGPAMLFLRRERYLDFVEYIFNVYSPVLGTKVPKRPGSAEREAARMGVYHKYVIERNCAVLADRVRCKAPGISGKLIKRQLGRGPDLFYASSSEKAEEADMRKSERSIWLRLKHMLDRERTEEKDKLRL